MRACSMSLFFSLSLSVCESSDRTISGVACAWHEWKRSISSGSINCTFNWHSTHCTNRAGLHATHKRSAFNWKSIYAKNPFASLNVRAHIVLSLVCVTAFAFHALLHFFAIAIRMWVFRCGTLKSVCLFWFASSIGSFPPSQHSHCVFFVFGPVIALFIAAYMLVIVNNNSRVTLNRIETSILCGHL